MGRQILFIRNTNSLHMPNSCNHQQFEPSPMLLLQQLCPVCSSSFLLSVLPSLSSSDLDPTIKYPVFFGNKVLVFFYLIFLFYMDNSRTGKTLPGFFPGTLLKIQKNTSVRDQPCSCRNTEFRFYHSCFLGIKETSFESTFSARKNKHMQ